MHTFFNRSLAAAAVTLAFAGAAMASQASKPASPPSQTKPATAPHATAQKSKASMTHSATGTITKYDANTLTLKTSSGEEQFMLASSARIQSGSKSIKPEDLSSLTGQRAKVRYTEANGQRTADSVMVSGARQSAAKSKSTKH